MIFFEFAMSLFDCILGACSISIFNRKSINPKKNKFLIPAIVIIFGFSILNYYLLPNHTVISPLIFMILSSVYGAIIADNNHFRGAVSGAVFTTHLVLLSAFIHSIFLVFIDNRSLIEQGSFSFERIMFLLITKIVLIASFLLAKRFIEKTTTLDLKSYILIFVISILSTLSLYSLISNLSSDFNPSVKAQTLTLSFSIFVINTLIKLLIYYINRLNKEKYDSMVLIKKMNADVTKNAEISRIYKEISLIRHDTGQHLTIINEYLNRGDIEGCKGYISKLWPALNRIPSFLKTGNETLDTIINSKIALLNDTQIVATGNVDFLKDMKEVDIVSLFGNILDNAIEATRESHKKLIELRFTSHNQSNIIICKNTTAHPVLRNNKDLSSTKLNPEFHGYGTMIIKKIVAEYNGILDFFEEDDMFGIEMVFPRIN